MMALQEEQQAVDDDDVGIATAGARGDVDANDIAGLGIFDGADPQIAFLDDDDFDDDDDDDVMAMEDDNGGGPRRRLPPAPHHPNHDNPAAIALRRRQAMMRDNLVDHRGRPRRINPTARLLRELSPIFRYVPMSMMAAFLLLMRTLRTRGQFYLALSYLQTSKLSYVILGNAIIAFSVGLFGVITSLFLDGGLRTTERTSIGENIRWDVTETCLALTIFRSELDVLTAIEFLVLVVMKCLHWSVELRGGHLRMTEEVFIYPDEIVDEDDSVPNGRSRWWHWWDHKRMPRLRVTHVSYYSLIVVLLGLDVLAVAHCALSVATHGASVDILFGFESAILLVSCLRSMGLYHLHAIDGVMGVFHHIAEGEHHRVPVGGLAEADEGRGSTQTPSDDSGSGDPAIEGGERRRPQDPQGEGGHSDALAASASAATALVDLCPPHPSTTSTWTMNLAKKLVERLANPWRDRRAMLSFAIELQAQAAKFMFYLVFFAIVFTYYGMPINIFREVYVSFHQLRRRLMAFNTYRRLTHNMDKRFESIKDEDELDRLGHTCIICRDSMDLSAPVEANDLPSKRLAGSQQAQVPSEAVQLDHRPTSSLTPPSVVDTLPPGWTQHVHDATGRPYYFNRGLGKTTWVKPTSEKTAPTEVSTTQQMNDDGIMHGNNFPCLYRITSSTGAAVYDRQAIQKRLVPQGKLIVCTSTENWPNEVMLCMPDGYIRCRDVSFEVSLLTPS
ncbi:hypothetical protein ACHAXA_003465 [Cyclostephanos tholiformis]|uniref:WW domain-containing protein n=1 Tax=Cyclostephanos tholiformis TaxID=382380 RepID=A0ABD3R7P9_9STRA